jgi:hypothetical protein
MRAPLELENAEQDALFEAWDLEREHRDRPSRAFFISSEGRR